MADDIRWKQRLENFNHALGNLEYAIALPSRDLVQRAGLVQFFEICFELSWKLLKDYLEAQGFNNVDSPRAALKKAFETGLIHEGTLWLQGLEARNLTTHLYNEAKAREIETLIIASYAPLFRALGERLNALASGA